MKTIILLAAWVILELVGPRNVTHFERGYTSGPKINNFYPGWANKKLTLNGLNKLVKFMRRFDNFKENTNVPGIYNQTLVCDPSEASSRAKPLG